MTHRFRARELRDAIIAERECSGALVPEYLAEYLETCSLRELKAFASIYRCPDCGGYLVVREGELREPEDNATRARR